MIWQNRAFPGGFGTKIEETFVKKDGDKNAGIRRIL
jgi:hypothetical protein